VSQWLSLTNLIPGKDSGRKKIRVRRKSITGEGRWLTITTLMAKTGSGLLMVDRRSARGLLGGMLTRDVRVEMHQQGSPGRRPRRAHGESGERSFFLAFSEVHNLIT